MSNLLSYDEFRAFAMLYAANAENGISPEEEIIIKSALPPDLYVLIRTRFDACSDAEALDILFEHRECHCADAGALDRLLSDMQKIYEAHESFSPVERNVHRIFKRIFS